MARADRTSQAEVWRRRLYVPYYGIGEAARYAKTSTQTAARWHGGRASPVLPSRARRAELSYMQLIELAVVAAMRSEGVKLKAIRGAREYVAGTLESEYPFAEYRFKTDGTELIINYEQIDPTAGVDKLLYASRGGQLGWKEILDRRLREFEYEAGGIVIRWRVGGDNSDVVIDPRVSFGAPMISGAATWAIKGRWTAGESVADIADDFSLSPDNVADALRFEDIQPDFGRQNLWAS